MLQIASTGTTATTALLKINGLNLLLPQSEIRTLESVSDMDSASPVLHSAGWITYSHKRWPVYCLSEDLSLMAKVPVERRACAMLAMGSGYIGVMCDDMIILKDFTPPRHELPDAMRLPQTPIEYLVSYDQRIACVSSANRLTAYIEQLVVKT